MNEDPELIASIALSMGEMFLFHLAMSHKQVHNLHYGNYTVH